MGRCEHPDDLSAAGIEPPSNKAIDDDLAEMAFNEASSDADYGSLD